MAYVSVPKDLMAVRTKVMFNLTKRQLTCFSMGGLFGLCVYLAIKGYVENSEAVGLMIVAMFPFFMLAMYQKNGQPLEVILQQMYQVKFGTAKIRPYKSQNFYSLLETQHDLNKEVHDIVCKKAKNSTSKTNSQRTSTKTIC